MPDETTTTSGLDSKEAVEGAADSIAQGIPQLVENIGTVGQTALIGGLVFGLVLWLLGRKIARPACAMSGLVVGGVTSALLLQELGFGQWMLAGLVAGGLICAVVAYLLFRVWMGLASAVVLALVAPALALIWQGNAPDVSQMERPDLAIEAPADESEQATRDALWQKAEEVYEHQKMEIGEVWAALGSAGQTTAKVAAAAGAIGGLLIGLLFPYMAASIQSACVGAVLIFFCGMALAHTWAPDQMAKLPEYGIRLPLLVIGIIALHGIGIQWTLSRRRADK